MELTAGTAVKDAAVAITMGVWGRIVLGKQALPSQTFQTILHIPLPKDLRNGRTQIQVSLHGVLQHPEAAPEVHRPYLL